MMTTGKGGVGASAPAAPEHSYGLFELYRACWSADE
jgi:hypothetical protein